MEQGNSSIFNFKLFLLKVFLPFIIGVCILSYTFTFLFEKKIILGSSISGAYKVNRIFNEVHPFEIPIFGSSRAKAGFVPSILGPNYFNYGLDGTRDDVMLMMMKEECKKKKVHSKIIISNFDLDGRFSLLGDISNYLCNSNQPSIKQLLGIKYKPYYSIPVIKYYGFFETFVGFYLSNKIQLTKQADNGGQFLKIAVPYNEFQRDVKRRDTMTQTFKNDLKLAKEYLDLINGNPDRLFVFVVGPYHKSYFSHYTNLNDAYKYLNDLSKIKNVRVFNFSSLKYPDSLFANTTHLNYKGAILFSKTLKDSLNKIIE